MNKSDKQNASFEESEQGLFGFADSFGSHDNAFSGELVFDRKDHDNMQMLANLRNKLVAAAESSSSNCSGSEPAS